MSRALVTAALALAVAACAQGGGGEDSGTPPPPPRDSGIRPRDTGPRPDTGGPTGSCLDGADEGHGRACMAATDVGPLLVGQMKTTDRGVLPADNPEDWLRIQFPESFATEMQGLGTPRIQFSVNESDAFRFEVQFTCGETAFCDSAGEVPASDATEWDFTDNNMDGEPNFLTREVPWPAEVWIRVYRATPGTDCPEYQLQVSR